MLATVHCDISQVVPAGDHDVVLGEVRELVTHRDAAPLVFFRGQYGLDVMSLSTAQREQAAEVLRDG